LPLVGLVGRTAVLSLYGVIANCSGIKRPGTYLSFEIKSQLKHRKSDCWKTNGLFRGCRDDKIVGRQIECNKTLINGVKCPTIHIYCNTNSAYFCSNERLPICFLGQFAVCYVGIGFIWLKETPRVKKLNQIYTHY